MKACPKCQMNNEDSGRFCKKCGSSLSSSTFQDKKEKVLGEGRKPYWVPVSLAVVAIALVAVGSLSSRETQQRIRRFRLNPR
jgi:uncharacterized membrane protein YvbJ